jgi:tetratricopeptide (TPR) repeat protein
MRLTGSIRLPEACYVLRLTVIAFSLAYPALAQVDIGKLYKEAKQAQASGDLATAIRNYEAIVRDQPKMAEAYANLGNLYYQQGQAERAKTAYRKALALKPELTGPNFFLGVIAFGEHDYSVALEQLAKAAATQPSNGLIYAYLGYTRFARSEFAEATTNLEKASALSGTDIDVLYHLSKCYGHLADRAFAKLQTEFPASVYLLLARAHLAESNEDWAGAAKQYRLALEKEPDNPRVRAKIEENTAMAAGKAKSADNTSGDELIDGSLAYKDTPPAGAKLKEEIVRWQSRVNEAGPADKDDRRQYVQGEGYQVLAYLTSVAVFELDQDSYRAHQLRAQMCEESKNDDGAIREYREALKRKPDLQNIHFAIGTLYWKNHNEEEAWTELQAELKTNPYHPQALYELGDICIFREKSAEAEKYLVEAVKLEPDLTEARYALEKIYTERGRYEKSLEQLRALLRMNSLEPTAHYRLAVVYRKLGRPQEAERELSLFNQNRLQPAPAQLGSSTVK